MRRRPERDWKGSLSDGVNMRDRARKYFQTLTQLVNDLSVLDKQGQTCDVYESFEKAANLILEVKKSSRKLMFIGNGASASIASHMAADFLKNGRVRALAFNDAPLLTCISNDIGYEEVFERPLEIVADPGDVLFAISSSGNSKNVLRGVQMALSKGCYVITLSGFAANNSLRSLGDSNFYVPFSSYGLIEVIHHSICHCILDGFLAAEKEGLK